MILSLKNIYKLLMDSDFPIYSEAGEAMGEAALAHLRTPEYGLQALFDRQNRQNAVKHPTKSLQRIAP